MRMSGQEGASRGIQRDSGEARRDQRLKSWKEIAAFFGANERTVKRWEAERGMPVHRLPGGARATVFAEVSQLEAWLHGQARNGLAPAVEETRAGAAREPARQNLLIGIAALAAAAVGSVALLGSSNRAPARPGAVHQPAAETRDVYLAGVYHLEKRTPAHLERARRYFTEAIARDPNYAEPYAGLADCFLLLREYASMPSADAYRRADSAARKAITLNGGLAGAHAALAFTTFYRRRDFPRALEGFRTAIALDPGSARAHHWYGTALLHLGRFPEALAELERARGLDPQSRSILADKGLALYLGGRSREGKALLRELRAAEPDFQSPRAYLALISLAEGNHAVWLAESREVASLQRNDERLALLQRLELSLVAGGGRAMLSALRREQQARERAGRESAYAVATTAALLGDREDALRHLRKAVAAGEADTIALRIDPLLISLRGETEYRQLLRRMSLIG